MRELYQLHPIEVPYGEATLPTYDVHPAESPRGTIVVSGGFDEYTEEIFPLLLAGAQGGYRIVAFDGPGQGGALEDDGLAMTPAWERPVGAVLDHFDLDDVTLIGISLGGGLAIRAAAFEPRIRRVVALDVLDNFLECVGQQAFPGATPALRLLLAAHARPIINLAARVAATRKPIAAWGLRQGMHVTGARDAYEFFEAAHSLSTHSISAKVTADVLRTGRSRRPLCARTPTSPPSRRTQQRPLGDHPAVHRGRTCPQPLPDREHRHMPTHHPHLARITPHTPAPTPVRRLAGCGAQVR